MEDSFSMDQGWGEDGFWDDSMDQGWGEMVWG